GPAPCLLSAGARVRCYAGAGTPTASAHANTPVRVLPMPTPHHSMTPQGQPASAESAFLHSYRGKFVVFEGPDGSGKSTQFRRLIDLFNAHGVPLTQVREPGGTVTGERIRQVLLDRANTGMTVRCEMLLYMASRAELVERTILPALQRSECVLADRFVASTLAYQGTAGGLPGADIAAVARVATRGLMPDVVLLFDVDQAVAARRLSPLLDRMEAKGAEFHRRVRQGYLDQAKADPRRYSVIDASQPEDAVWAATLKALRERV
ncbi:MAG: dTMP kinase, partial [Phycisphaerales bacterium]